ncbi:BTB/POZ domain-containing protein At1g03010 [Amborella trichopoda]|uniref:NPH3 domain-containing protein n=1 Tax=Amborella trichopoda TaxID=13333 RepID=W1PGV8_AMBTC|nr:BTB/POZ domain-containing protein At1g03010 [Amborella trichopoda]ERN06330.1 hypothetical protein AMTR_s00016p00237490 [Amborella trichopoda]|eukprot:XP_006844655.1 BTB/POZ domain-containing protein At1g03010 [Amborella trichopoda]
MGAATVTDLKRGIVLKRSIRWAPSTMQKTSDWLLTDVPSDLTVEVGSKNFSLHKFPLASQSGRIRKLLAQPKDVKITKINLSDIPGGPEAFEHAAKFCYGVSLEITASNVAMLRCAADYLEMTEEYGQGSLESRTERHLNEIVIPSIPLSVTVLHRCETLIPSAEETKIICRCINAIASNACKEQLSSGLSKLEHSGSTKATSETQLGFGPNQPDWWGKSLIVLNMDLFQRVLGAMKSKGLKQDIISRILMHYAHSSLLNLTASYKSKGRFSEGELQKQRLLVEAIVCLLPTPSKRSTVPLGFLSGLLKTCLAVDASPSSREELERRIGMQLDQAILDDLLIPIKSKDDKTPLFDTDAVHRMFMYFLQLVDEDREGERMHDGSESPGSTEQNTNLKVSKLMDNYLTEVAGDPNVSPCKFIPLAELLPDHVRLVYDGLYRAIDIFLKVHPSIKESERYKLCKNIDCQKLSPEACSHAAQNERLPVQMAVQILYFEQLRLRNEMQVGHDHHFGSFHSSQTQKYSGGSPRDSYASVRRENKELKLELTRIRMRLNDLEKDHVSIRKELVKTNPANKILTSFTKKLKKLNALLWAKDTKKINNTTKVPSDIRFLIPKKRR